MKIYPLYRHFFVYRSILKYHQHISPMSPMIYLEVQRVALEYLARSDINRASLQYNLIFNGLYIMYNILIKLKLKQIDGIKFEMIKYCLDNNYCVLIALQSDTICGGNRGNSFFCRVCVCSTSILCKYDSDKRVYRHSCARDTRQGAKAAGLLWARR